MQTTTDASALVLVSEGLAASEMHEWPQGWLSKTGKYFSVTRTRLNHEDMALALLGIKHADGTQVERMFKKGWCRLVSTYEAGSAFGSIAEDVPLVMAEAPQLSRAQRGWLETWASTYRGAVVLDQANFGKRDKLLFDFTPKSESNAQNIVATLLS